MNLQVQRMVLRDSALRNPYAGYLCNTRTDSLPNAANATDAEQRWAAQTMRGSGRAAHYIPHLDLLGETNYNYLSRRRWHMSAATDFLQRFIDLKRAFDSEPRYDSPATGLPWRMQLGVEITIVEASRCDAHYEADGTTFHASIAPGQKSYIRGTGAQHTQAVVGIQWGAEGIAPVTILAGLRFTGQEGFVDRWYAYDPARTSWGSDMPFRNDAATGVASVEVSLVPFRLGGSYEPSVTGPVPEQPDDRVHVLVRRRDDQVVLLSNVAFDAVTQQFYGYGPSMDADDNSSLWILSFYIA